MINLAGIGHVLLRVADEEASKRFYRDVFGFRVAEQDPEHGGVFIDPGRRFSQYRPHAARFAAGGAATGAG